MSWSTQRRLAVLSWMGGWYGGPLIPGVIWLSSRTKHSTWIVRQARSAAIFWAAAVLIYAVAIAPYMVRGAGIAILRIALVFVAIVLPTSVVASIRAWRQTPADTSLRGIPPPPPPLSGPQV